MASFSPDVVLVERGVARFAQELMLEKGIALVINVKLPKLDRIARCIGVQVRQIYVCVQLAKSWTRAISGARQTM